MQPKPAMRKIFISSEILNLPQKNFIKKCNEIKMCRVSYISLVRKTRLLQGDIGSNCPVQRKVEGRERGREGVQVLTFFTSLLSCLSFCLLFSYNFSFLWPILLSRKYITNFLLYFQRHLTREFSSLVQFPELLSSNPVFY